MPQYAHPNEEEFDPIVVCHHCKEEAYEVNCFRDWFNVIRCEDCTIYLIDEELEARAADEEIYKVRVLLKSLIRIGETSR
jgi:hypothetical protein